MRTHRNSLGVVFCALAWSACRSVAGALERAQPPVVCELLPWLVSVASCPADVGLACARHYVTSAAGVSRCRADAASGRCSQGPPVSCQQRRNDQPLGLTQEQFGRKVKACIEELGTSIWAEVESETSASYQLREKHVVGQMQPIFDRLYHSLGYAGLLACAAFQMLPIELEKIQWPTAYSLGPQGNETFQSTVYNLVLFNSFICPGLTGGGEQMGRLPVGRLGFSCLPNAATARLYSKMGEPKAATYRQTPTGESTAAEKPPRANNVSAPWLSHSWGCAAHRSGTRTNFKLTTGDGVDSAEGGIYHGNLPRESTVGIYHAHLPRAACDAMRSAGQQQQSSFHKLQEYIVRTDTHTMNFGKHGLLHEYGAYIGKRLLALADEETLSGTWELFALFYVSPAPMHGFQWTLIADRWRNNTFVTVAGRPLLRWLVDFCARFLLSSELYGDPSNELYGDPKKSDPNRHLFGECAHGVGHGDAKAGRRDRLCSETLPVLAERLNASSDFAPSEHAMLRKLWVDACHGGYGHQMHSV